MIITVNVWGHYPDTRETKFYKIFFFILANNLKLCFSGSESDSLGNATFSCPDGQGIHISDALFGRNKWGSCVLLDGDCVEKTRIFQNCENQSTCSRQFKTYTTACGYSTVMFLSYTCLPGKNKQHLFAGVRLSYTCFQVRISYTCFQVKISSLVLPHCL